MDNKNPLNIAIIGLGTVGAGTLDLLRRNYNDIYNRTHHPYVISHVGSRRPRPDLDLSNIVVSNDLLAIARDPQVDIVIEVIGGLTTAKDVITEAISHGKHVITANKALLALHGNELFSLANQHNVQVRYEAAVAGGIPIIKVLREGLSANRIDWLAGIINGTGNFILSAMRDKSRSFADALAEAQALGYAEADPTFDVEGIDAAHKLMLLAANAFGIPLDFAKMSTEGITQLTAADMRYADELGYIVKHLGIARRNNDSIELRVHPALIPKTSLLANVHGVKNAVMVHGDAVGATLFYGAGAGAGPTSSAVVADLVDIMRTLQCPEHTPPLAFKNSTALPITRMDNITCAYYLRLLVADQPGVLTTITDVLSKAGINIDAVLQKPEHPASSVPIVLLCQPISEHIMNKAISTLQALPVVMDKVMRIRIEPLES